MLAATFSGRHELKRRADGRIFIDRDGELFKYVLQYLRDGDLDVEHLDQGLRKRLKREAAFYCLPGLAEKLTTGAVDKGQPAAYALLSLPALGRLVKGSYRKEQFSPCGVRRGISRPGFPYQRCPLQRLPRLGATGPRCWTKIIGGGTNLFLLFSAVSLATTWFLNQKVRRTLMVLVSGPFT
jgi:hypothetical protein